ncbi:von Willebrand factor A domain-containing 8, partial [Brachionus plicatilis]
HDFVLIGPTGCGKTELINKFASLLDYSTQSMHLFKDMSARDLIQQRITETNGDTKWLNSPLIEAAINGDLMILG